MKDLNKIQEFFSKPLEEMDLNDPVLMKMRAAKNAVKGDSPASQGKRAAIGDDISRVSAKKLAFLKKERAQLMRDMEQEAEPEGGPIADEYGSKLNRIDKAIAKLSGRKEMTYDQAIAENKLLKQAKLSSAEYQKVKKLKDFNPNDYEWNPSESLYVKEKKSKFKKHGEMSGFDMRGIDEASVASISMPKFVKDKNNPNFLNVYIKYDTGAGATMALGRETGSGQDRRNNAAEAMKLANNVARDLEAEYNIEDIEIVDQENGVVSIFAVSDDFINMDPNMLNEASKGAMNYFSDLKFNYQKAFRYLDVEEREEYKRLAKDFFSKLEVDDKVREAQGILQMDEVEIGDKVKINKEYGGGKGKVTDKIGSFIVVNGESYHESDVEESGMNEEEGYSKFLKDDPEFPGGKTKGLTPDVMNKILMRVVQGIEESRPGLWDNIRTKQERSEKPSRKGSKAYKTAVKAGKEINKAKN